MGHLTVYPNATYTAAEPPLPSEMIGDVKVIISFVVHVSSTNSNTRQSRQSRLAML